MTVVRIKGFKIFKDRHGRMRCYHRETGQKIDLVKAPLGSADFFTECKRISAIAEANKAKAPKVGTLGGLMNTGLDPSDALNLRRDQIDGETIWGVLGKTGVEVAIPIGPTLHAALKQAPQHDAPALLANSRGEQWAHNGFSTVWHRFKTGLEAEGLIQPGLTLKGLRHTVATTLREAGLDERRIADFLGQKTLSMARHYSRSANLAAKNRETMATLETENARRARIVKPSAKSVKPEPKGKSE